jgi:hypothetical protein
MLKTTVNRTEIYMIIAARLNYYRHYKNRNFLKYFNCLKISNKEQGGDQYG